jgi:hypothetical protein
MLDESWDSSSRQDPLLELISTAREFRRFTDLMLMLLAPLEAVTSVSLAMRLKVFVLSLTLITLSSSNWSKETELRREESRFFSESRFSLSSPV